MIKTVRDAWKIPELRNKILFTIFALLIFRLGAAIPVPYINGAQLETYLTAQSGTILGLMNAMSGSAFSMATLFALSVQPYINSSIIIQLLTVAIPALERLAKEGGEEGRKKIASITRYTTVAIGLLQGFGYYTLINSYGLVETDGLPAIWVGLVSVLSFTAGSGGVHRVHLQRRAPPACAVCQAGGGPEDVRRSVHPHPHQGEHERRYAHHLRPVHRLPACHHRRFCRLDYHQRRFRRRSDEPV